MIQDRWHPNRGAPLEKAGSGEMKPLFRAWPWRGGGGRCDTARGQAGSAAREPPGITGTGAPGMTGNHRDPPPADPGMERASRSAVPPLLWEGGCGWQGPVPCVAPCARRRGQISRQVPLPREVRKERDIPAAELGEGMHIPSWGAVDV